MSNVYIPARENEAYDRLMGNIRPGDLVTNRSGYPVLYEVLTVDRDGLLRVRGMNWAPGYSATISAAEVRPVTGALAEYARPAR